MHIQYNAIKFFKNSLENVVKDSDVCIHETCRRSDGIFWLIKDAKLKLFHVNLGNVVNLRFYIL
jgi:hypothetical protein